MKHNHTARRVALGLLLAGIAIPVAAQETQPVTPPAVTPPAAEAPAPVEAAPAPTPAPSASPTIQFAPQSPVVQTQLPPPPPADSVREAAPTRSPARTVTRSNNRPAATQRVAPAAAAAAAPAAAPSPVAAAPTPAPEPVAAAPAPADAVTPAAEADQTATTTTTSTNSSDLMMWAPIVLGGIIVLGLIAYVMSARRRRANEMVYEEPYYAPVEEAPAAADVEEPVAAAPVVEDASRPWIDVGLRPIRAGATDDAAQVQLELTVSNSGDQPAHDVRVSTWMLADAQGSDNDQALIDARTNAQTAAFDLAPGADRSVDTTLDLPRAAVNGSFRPLVVAEARYPLPDGTEGRIAATFEVGQGDEVAPIATDGMHEDVGARLHEVLERS